MGKSGNRKRSLIPQTAGKIESLRRGMNYYDYNLVAVIILLTCFGLIMLYSTSAYTAEMTYKGDDMFFFRKQALISLFCIIGAFFISLVDYHMLAFFVTPLYGVAVVTMILVKTPLGQASHGASRWLKIGPITFQPAEIAKIAVIVCVSYTIVQMGRSIRSLKACMMLGCMGGFLGLVAYVFTDNLSTAIIICGITAGMIFLAHPDTKVFMIILIVFAVFVFLFVFFLSRSLETSTSFRIRRILVWLHPEDFSDNEGYQTMQSLYAIGSGGIFGRGLGNSIQKLGSVPEAQNDMIFSIICEELGIIGALLVVMMFAYLLFRLFFIATNAPDMFGALLVSGVFIHIALQVVLNISVVINLIPNTGVTLPFISYGGTSILFLMSEMGLALSVSRQIKLQQVEQLL